MDSDRIPNIHNEMISVIRLIPIVGNEIRDGDINTKFDIPLDVIDHAKKIGYDSNSISVRDIINLMTKFFQSKTREELINEPYYKFIKDGVDYARVYVLFDYCLAALSKDITDATLYLSHSYNILNLYYLFHELLRCITKKEYLDDKDIRKFLAVLANDIQPTNASDHKDDYGQEYRDRFDTYCKELEKA